MSYTFEVGPRDEYGCTEIHKKVFENTLGLDHHEPITVRRVTGQQFQLSALKCTSKGRKFYQLDLSELDLSRGARVTFRVLRHNHVLMTVVEKAHKMWEQRGVVDAIVELQYAIDELHDRIDDLEDEFDEEFDDDDDEEQGDNCCCDTPDK